MLGQLHLCKSAESECLGVKQLPGQRIFSKIIISMSCKISIWYQEKNDSSQEDGRKRKRWLKYNLPLVLTATFYPFLKGLKKNFILLHRIKALNWIYADSYLLVNGSLLISSLTLSHSGEYNCSMMHWYNVTVVEREVIPAQQKGPRKRWESRYQIFKNCTTLIYNSVN